MRVVDVYISRWADVEFSVIRMNVMGSQGRH